MCVQLRPTGPWLLLLGSLLHVQHVAGTDQRRKHADICQEPYWLFRKRLGITLVKKLIVNPREHSTTFLPQGYYLPQKISLFVTKTNIKNAVLSVAM